MPFGGIGRFSRGKSQPPSSNQVASQPNPTNESNHDLGMEVGSPSTDTWIQFDGPSVSEVNIDDDLFVGDIETGFSYTDHDGFSIGPTDDSSVTPAVEAVAASKNTTTQNTGLFNKFKALATNVPKDLPQETLQGQIPSDKENQNVSLVEGGGKSEPALLNSSKDERLCQPKATTEAGTLSCGGFSPNTNQPTEKSWQDDGNNKKPATTPTTTPPATAPPERVIEQETRTPDAFANQVGASSLGRKNPEDPDRVLPYPRSVAKTQTGLVSSPPVQIRTPVNEEPAAEHGMTPNFPSATAKLSTTPAMAEKTPIIDAVSNKVLPAVTPGPHSPVNDFASHQDKDAYLHETTRHDGGDAGISSTEPPSDETHVQEASDEPKATSLSNSVMKFDDLHAKFLSDIRDLQDIQNENSTRLLKMNECFSSAFSESLRDQANFIDLFEELEKASKLADEIINRFQQS